ncbi:MAG: hypothetical protein VZR00_10510 [Lachnospiraceae bacterium]|nr:hypothetical protein [Lachnospiraceae bacterium]
MDNRIETFSDAAELYFSSNLDLFTGNELEILRKSARKFKLLASYSLSRFPKGMIEIILDHTAHSDFSRRKARFIMKRIISYAAEYDSPVIYRELTPAETIQLQLKNTMLLLDPYLTSVSREEQYPSLGGALLELLQEKQRTESYNHCRLWRERAILLERYYSEDLRSIDMNAIADGYPKQQRSKIIKTLNEVISCMYHNNQWSISHENSAAS